MKASVILFWPAEPCIEASPRFLKKFVIVKKYKNDLFKTEDGLITINSVEPNPASGSRPFIIAPFPF
jgi:hypothetical protein